MSELVRDWKAEKKDLQEAFDLIADQLCARETEIRKFKALITELCDELEEEFGTLDHRPALKDKRPWNIIQRARAAAK